MSSTIAIFKEKYIEDIFMQRDINAIFNFDECTYDKSQLEKPLDNIYSELVKSFPPMNGEDMATDEKIDDCVEYGFLPNAIYIGYSRSQYIKLMEVLRPLVHYHECAIYKSDDNSIEYSGCRSKYKSKTKLRRWIIAICDTLILFLMFEGAYIVFNWLFSMRPDYGYDIPPLIDFSAISLSTWTIGAAALASTRILVEFFAKHIAKRKSMQIKN